VLATINDAFGAALRSLARPLTVAPRGAWQELAGPAKRPILSEQRNAGEARLNLWTQLGPNLWNEVFCWWLRMVLLGATNWSRGAALTKGRRVRCGGKVTFPPSSACGAYPVAATRSHLEGEGLPTDAAASDRRPDRRNAGRIDRPRALPARLP
jgi:hypothetical protein